MSSHLNSERRLRNALLVVAVLLAALAVWMASLLYPATQAVRVRNAFLLEAPPVTQSVFDWQPEAVPSSFRSETRPAPPNIRAGVTALLRDAPASDWTRALLLTEHLTKGARGGGSIQSELGASYDLIVNKGRGYCADFTKVFQAMAHEAGIPVRQWAFAFDGFGGHGHALIEIYDRGEKRWKMIDVFNNIYAVDEGGGQVLGALEFRQFILGQRKGVVIRQAAQGRLGFPIEEKLIDYYRRGADQWYLWWANDVVTYNADPTLTKARLLGNSVEKLVATITGAHPTIQILATDSNADEVVALVALRRSVIFVLAAGSLLALVFVVLAVRWWSVRRRVQRGTERPARGRDG